MCKIVALPVHVLKTGLFLVLCALFLTACGDEEDDFVYPSLLTEFVELYTDDVGNGTLLTTDGGSTYAVQTPLQGLQPEAVYRIVCGYELTGESQGNYPIVKVYTAENVYVLDEKAGNSEDDAPTGVAGIWRGGKYLNFHLNPKTQGGFQEWGFRMDGVRPSSTGKTYQLSLYHRQPDDPYSYTTDVYASLPLGSLEELQAGDSIAFTVLTFDGQKTWRFAY